LVASGENMYLQHWGMQTRAFDNSHAPEIFVPVESSMLALTKIRYAVSMGLGCVCLYGMPGVGKTELLRMALLDFGNSGWATAYLANPSGTRNEIFINILHRVAGEIKGNQTPLEALELRLEEIGAEGGKVLLAIDDAQSVSDVSLLDDLRMLLNIERGGVPVMNVIIAGQDGVLQRLSEASRFDCRVAMKVRVVPFNVDEANAYVLSRIKNSGCSRGIFTRQAAQMIYDATGGVAGNINRLCELALVTAYTEKLNKIRPELIRSVAMELGLKNDFGLERMLDEIWSDDLPPLEAGAEAEVDVLADLARENL